MPLFLNARNWQLFLMLATPLATFRLFADHLSVLQSGFMLFLFVGAMVGWLYSVGISANDRLPPELQINPRFFKFGLVAPLVYLLAVSAVILIPLAQGEADFRPPSWILPLHFAALAGFVYALWFTAKQFVTLQKGSRTSYIEYAFPLLGFWFGVIGVWFLQPRVNRLLGDKPPR